MYYSIIKKSELGGTLRLDAEYYQPEFLKNSKKIINFGSETLQSLSTISITKGETPLWRGDDYLKKGIPFLRSENLISAGLDLSNIVFISKKVHDRMKRSKIFPNDILIAIVGATIGNTGMVTKNYSEYNSNQANAIIRPSNHDISNYLAIILESKICQLQIERLKGGGARDNLDLHEVQSILVPKPQKGLVEYCSSIIDQVTILRKKSQDLYSQAESLLLEELGLKNFESEIKRELWSVIDLSVTKKVNRIDADYFQPKYQKLMSLIRANGGITLSALATIKKGFEPGSEAYQEEGKTFIRVSSISKDGVIDKDQKYLKEELYEKLKKDYQPKVGEILLTKDASPGVAYVIKEFIEGIVSGGVLRVRMKEDIEPEYLALVINSIVGQLQVERDVGGSVIMHWKPDQVKEMQIPILSKPIQQKISELVRKSHEARKKAKGFLEEAKHKIEELIENNQK